ncbi:hypothetical protein [Pyrococcus kukulkanii]|uniref:Restriction endonuclease n=1 Tax=Pyrococcus kukulkanii TaxID=1609559 RepID=A0A127B8B4_9EURY|nr:hypothetical protein [Pyrococcus kukulkanii]AMM53508.1 hypothetical protein TQ32_02640 [Pyrococcus kukulkanii]
MVSRVSMIRQAVRYGPSIYKPFFDYMKREVKSAENRYLFSSLVEQLFPGKFALYDLDSIIFDKESNTPIAAFELKFKSWFTAEEAWLNKELEVNGRQFLRLRILARRMEIPIYYFVQVGKYFVMFNVLRVGYELEERHEGPAKDLYAIINLDDAIVSRSLEDLKTDLSLLLRW